MSVTKRGFAKAAVRVLVASMMIAAAVFGVAGSASASSPGDVSQCKSGGYANFVDPATGQPFTNQGRCVTVVARGGALVPFVPPATVGSWAITPFDFPTGAFCHVAATLTGAVSTTYPVTWLSGPFVLTDSVTTDTNGTAALYRDWLPENQPAELVVDDQTLTVPTVSCHAPTTVTFHPWSPSTTPGTCDTFFDIATGVGPNDNHWADTTDTDPGDRIPSSGVHSLMHIPSNSVLTGQFGALPIGDEVTLTIDGIPHFSAVTC